MISFVCIASLDMQASLRQNPYGLEIDNSLISSWSHFRDKDIKALYRMCKIPFIKDVTLIVTKL
jgi:hypothetical protein